MRNLGEQWVEEIGPHPTSIRRRMKMFVDKKGKEITAGCKILIGSHTFTISNLDEEVRPVVKEWLAECATIVESDQESDMNLNFTSHLPLEPTPLKEWLNIPPAPEVKE